MVKYALLLTIVILAACVVAPTSSAPVDLASAHATGTAAAAGVSYAEAVAVAKTSAAHATGLVSTQAAAATSTAIAGHMATQTQAAAEKAHATATAVAENLATATAAAATTATAVAEHMATGTAAVVETRTARTLREEEIASDRRLLFGLVLTIAGVAAVAMLSIGGVVVVLYVAARLGRAAALRMMVIETRTGTAFLGYINNPQVTAPAYAAPDPFKVMLGAVLGSRPLAIDEPDNLTEAPTATAADKIVVNDARGRHVLERREAPELAGKYRLVGRLLRAAMLVEGGNGRKIPRWTKLPGFTSGDTWARATALIGPMLDKGKGGTYVKQEFGSLVELYERVISRQVRLD